VHILIATRTHRHIYSLPHILLPHILTATYPHCHMCSLPHILTAAYIHCHIYSLPHILTAAYTHCHIYSLPHILTATYTHCHMCSLPHILTATYIHCHMCSLPHILTAAYIHCHMYSLPPPFSFSRITPLPLWKQMGSFVPATQATIGVVDRIFTRVSGTVVVVGCVLHVRVLFAGEKE